MPYPVADRAGTSPMQEAFDADVRVAVAEIGLYLVVGVDAPSLTAALAAVEAPIAARLSPIRVLAVTSIAGFERLRGDRGISLVGPVHLDPARFELFQRFAGIETGEDQT